MFYFPPESIQSREKAANLFTMFLVLLIKLFFFFFFFFGVSPGTSSSDCHIKLCASLFWLEIILTSPTISFSLAI